MLVVLMTGLLNDARAARAVLASGEALTEALAEALIIETLAAEGETGRFRLRIASPALPVGNPHDRAVTLRLDHVDYEPRQGRFQARLAVVVEDSTEGHLQITGRAERLIEIPVPARTLGAGEVIRAEDLVWQTMAERRVGSDAIVDMDQLIGAEARRRLSAERPVRLAHIGQHRLVQKGRTVTMVYRRPGIELAARGRAMEDGVFGQTISLKSAHGGRQVWGRVVGGDQVLVGE